MPGRLEGHVAVITGGGRGIGQAIAHALAGAGARLALCARSQNDLDATAAALRQAAQGPVEVLTMRCDIASDSDVTRFAAAVQRQLGAPHILVNNAGIVARGRLDEQAPADWIQVLDVNLLGAYRMTRAFLPAMRAVRRGRIINVSSISGRLGTPLLTAYCASKHGLIGLTRALAEEVRQDGLQVNAICPGSVDTEMLVGSGFTPAMTPEDVARVALFLATDAPAALTGACLDVFG
ncbi:MAG TPA: SDR family oxidoreductase [Polyangia bacterium]|jgi:3-oxoacyl-[acyl-carrier protein] reductase|nr:SDR family oxidoreductase [Polyangia bacterium]